MLPPVRVRVIYQRPIAELRLYSIHYLAILLGLELSQCQ